MLIRDFSLPSPYFAPMPSRQDSEERTENLQQAWQKHDWDAVHAILLKGPVDPAVRDAVLFEALEQAGDITCAFLVAAARSLEPLPAATDSQILVMAAEKNHREVVRTQLEFGLIQPWAIRAALHIAEQSNNKELLNLLCETKPIIPAWNP